jgi:hypothetical protein
MDQSVQDENAELWEEVRALKDVTLSAQAVTAAAETPEMAALEA